MLFLFSKLIIWLLLAFIFGLIMGFVQKGKEE